MTFGETYRGEAGYLQMLGDCLDRGEPLAQRAVVADAGGGRDPGVLSLVGPRLQFDLRGGFPLFTCRRVSFRVAAEELAWFVSGSTSVGPLQAKGVHIWDAWADESGDLGPVYGELWRAYPEAEGGRLDQLALLESRVRAVAADPRHPAARRLLLVNVHPGHEPQSAPQGCHTLAQFFVRPGSLHCQVYQRSADLYFGVPYNVACYTLLTHALAAGAGLEARGLQFCYGDAHLYGNTLTQAVWLAGRTPLPAPYLERVAALGERPATGFRAADYAVRGYRHHPDPPGIRPAVAA